MPQASTRGGTVGLTHPELRRLVDGIDALLGQEEQGAIGVGLQGIRDWLQCRLESTKHSFSSITESSLTEMNISTIGDLKWKGTNIPPEPPMELDVSPGSDVFWTEAWLTQHLRRLERRIVFMKEAASRMWIDAFLLYVSDEIYATNGMTMVLSPEQHVPPTTLARMSTHSLSGEVDWAVVVTSGTGAELFRCSKANLQKLDYNYSSLFIVEAKGPSEDLEGHIPQAIGEMYASARISGKTTIRGVISNGFSWCFLILTVNNMKEAGGGTFWKSDVVFIGTERRYELSEQGISKISSVLARWVAHSNSPWDDDDAVYFDLLQSSPP